MIKYIFFGVLILWAMLHIVRFAVTTYMRWKTYGDSISLRDKVIASICWGALILSALFLIIGVDYFPFAVCYLPLFVSIVFVSQSKAFKKSFNKLADIICGKDY